MIRVIDQTGFQLSFNKPPQKIISLVPSISETFAHVGLQKSLVGITKFCIHPHELYTGVKKIGGTKNPKVHQMKLLQPDFIIANKEENKEEDITILREMTQVYVSDISTINHLIAFFNDMEAIFQNGNFACLIPHLEKIASFEETMKLNVCYLIWKNPWMTVGNDTFIHFMLHKFGFNNIFKNQTRYPIVSLDDIRALKPDVVFLSSEPYPFKKSELQHISQILPECKVVFINGEMCSWYGTRLFQATHYLRGLHSSLIS